MPAASSVPASPAIASPPWGRAVAAQCLGTGGAVCLAAVWSMLTGTGMAVAAWLAAQAACAALAAAALRMPWWWIALNLAFAPALALATAAVSSPAWPAAALAALLLVFGGTQRTRVPLYVSGRRTVDVLRGLVPAGRPVRFLDLGAGTGTVLAAVTRGRANVRACGIERAPVPFLAAWLRSVAAGRRYAVRWGDLWDADLSAHDIVYAYLSPAPMAALWEKASREMRPGALLVSHRFAVPGVAPSRVLAAGSATLYVWEMP